MSNYNYVVKLGKRPLEPRYFIRKVAWPVYVWKAVLPNYYTEKLDVLQHLVLSLAEINRLIDGYVIPQLGISKELISAVRQSCQEEGYLDREYKLTKSGELVLKGSLSFEESIMTNYEQIYIFRDGLTGDVIPNFSVKLLPANEKVISDYVLKKPKRQMQAPTFIELGLSLQLRKNINRFITTNQNDYAVEDVEVNQFENDFFDDFSVDVHWEDVTESGHLKSLAEAEEIQAEMIDSQDEIQAKDAIKIVSLHPELLWLEAEFYVDPDMPEQLKVSSPFGDNEGDWFTKHLLLHGRQDPEVSEIIDFFMEEAKEMLIDKYPFNNNLSIELFNKHPHIANYEKWQPIRECVEAMTRSYNRLNEGHEDYDTFYSRSHRLLEAVLSAVIQQLPNKKEVMWIVSKSSFRPVCERIASELRIEIPGNLMGGDFYRRLCQVAQGRGMSIKDRALFLAFDAYKHTDETPSLALLRNVPGFYDKINHISKVRNVTVHFSEDAKNVTQDYEQIKQDVDFLVDLLIIHYLKVGI